MVPSRLFQSTSTFNVILNRVNVHLVDPCLYKVYPRLEKGLILILSFRIDRVYSRAIIKTLEALSENTKKHQISLGDG